MPRIRRNIGDVQINRRYGALCAAERVRLKFLMRCAVGALAMANDESDEEEEEELEMIAILALAMARDIGRDRTVLRRSVYRRNPVRIGDVIQ